MQGQLSELDIRSIFQLIDIGQQTGELYIESFDRQGQPTSWLLFFANGGILYAGRTNEQLVRLRDLLQPYNLADRWHNRLDLKNLAPLRPPEYGALWWLLENGVVTPQQARATLYRLIEETLFEVISLHEGRFSFHFHASLSPQLTEFSLAPFLNQVTRQLQGWLKLQPHVSSIYDCPLSTIPPVEANSDELSALLTKADGKTSILKLSRQLHRPIFSIANELYPHIQRGDIQFINRPQPLPLTKTKGSIIQAVPRIVCIDDTASIRQTVEMTLDTHGYEVTSIASPVKALSLLFSLKPDLILCDIAMPDIEGHQLCAMLRQAPYFQALPIVMLTGKNNFVDRVKANMAGATDYLTKPFDSHELLALVEKYVGRGNPKRLAPETLLEQEISATLNPESWSTP
ncbi:response regulator [Leptothoe kymatousa]|uniref:Response regulator n=1 Tax=Leptothoe kymatousa TAU-MAC 1615 TaxID=2364775 RepID=A0ABS5Y1G5_9CYAN|nr:response regulator [Leptothoe kymatousa]MBT9311353.1 response regulator [Leptothoe kymatousa TAU-MAC 1615]